jgi:predicted Zn-dependent peptidase
VWDPYAEFEKTVLPNGLTVYTSQWHGRMWESFGFIIHSGADQDPIGKEGSAHFLEHMVNANSQVPTNEIDRFFKRHGGHVMLGATRFRSTQYEYSLPADHQLVAKALLIFGDMLFKEDLSKGLERERKIITEEFNRSNRVGWKEKLARATHESLYNSHPRRRLARVIGSLDSISRIDIETLRSFYGNHYTPANMSVVALGGFPKDEVIDLLSASPFAVTRAGTRTPMLVPAVEVPAPAIPEFNVRMSEYASAEGVEKTARYSFLSLVPGTVPYAAPPILSKMLSSRLFQEIREKRELTYSVNALAYNYIEIREIGVRCDSFDPKNAEEMIRAIDDVIGAVSQDEDLFQTEKQIAINSLRMADVSGRGLVGGCLNDLDQFQRIVPMSESIDQQEAVSFADIQTLARYLEKDRRVTVLEVP